MSGSAVTSARLAIRPLRANEDDHVRRLLVDLPSLYPAADAWLDRRLADVAEGRASCSIAIIAGAVAGVTIVTPKEPGREKLSTLFVAPPFRGLRVGHALVAACWTDWVARRVQNVTVTVRHGIHAPLVQLLSPFGFDVVALDRRRYGASDEVILGSSLDRAGGRWATSHCSVNRQAI